MLKNLLPNWSWRESLAHSWINVNKERTRVAHMFQGQIIAKKGKMLILK